MSVIDSPPVVSALVADAEVTRLLDNLDHASIVALSDAEPVTGALRLATQRPRPRLQLPWL